MNYYPYVKYIYILLSIIYLVYYLYRRFYQHQNIEHFDVDVSIHESVIKTNHKDIYDDFYAEVYDPLFLSNLRQEYEMLNIHKIAIKPWKGKVKILDVGCGTGNHLKIIKNYNIHCEGIDQSKYMIQKARLKNDKAIFKKGDFDQIDSYDKGRFTHIICLFFAVYYSKNYDNLFYNFNYWLQPKGYVAVHVINRKKFDPVLERSSTLIPLFDPQAHVKERSTRTVLHFKKFSYESDWDFGKKKTTFREVFKFKKNPYNRVNIHKVDILPSKKFIEIANNNGFELVKIVDMFLIGWEYNYILIFKKKYNIKH